eukprot:9483243-Pyramimonas_sp.AAC.1
MVCRTIAGWLPTTVLSTGSGGGGPLEQAVLEGAGKAIAREVQQQQQDAYQRSVLCNTPSTPPPPDRRSVRIPTRGTRSARKTTLTLRESNSSVRIKLFSGKTAYEGLKGNAGRSPASYRAGQAITGIQVLTKPYTKTLMLGQI